ncbi:MAG: hypothetical protein DGJ47_000902 [Rickettsiaceae bacterium]
MLNKLLVHLKNVLFFKVVVYLLVFIGLILLIPIFENDLKNAQTSQDKSKIFLQTIANKLDSIDDFKSEIISINNRYNELVNMMDDPYCEERLMLMSYIASLGKKYKLQKPINQTISRSYQYEDSVTTNHSLAIEYHIIDLYFSVKDVRQLLIISQDLYSSLPKGSVVLEQSINKIEEITPKIAASLTPGVRPSLISVKIKIMLRHVIYQK